MPRTKPGRRPLGVDCQEKRAGNPRIRVEPGPPAPGGCVDGNDECRSLQGMFDDLFEHIDFGGAASKRAQTLFRIVFGVLGLFLAGAGIWHVLWSAKFSSAGIPFRLAAANLFGFVGLFFAINVALHKPQRWPGRGVLASLVLLFVVRLGFGP